ncbi:hypothetical protein DPV78_003777 [Talaromyces pinophilus]|nr:hypothetical protein DPV78_003777 [Talaromyces pinophilus]
MTRRIINEPVTCQPISASASQQPHYKSYCRFNTLFDHINFLNGFNSKVLLSFADVGPTTREMIIGLMSQSQLESEAPTDCYTVGWICALQEEYECACRMLDEYSGPEIENQDDNTYAYGRIAKHYMVIGYLPAGC